MDVIKDLAEPGGFAVKGVVRNGQVVLDVPLDLPNGTVVTVKEYDESDYPAAWGPPDPEKLRALRDDLEQLRAKALKWRASRGGQEAA